MYQVIARTYRPQSFDEVVGQGHVKRTLRNAIDQGRIAHGYIFSGPRGTGKTTIARILAMALNCEDGPSSSHDPTSVVCREIAAGGSLDVIEIDAASNRRIDDIRELREAVRFRPVRDRYKVFIIDEAHQITSDAFNALLKTLEEPPEWAVFVLCTTEPQAIPITITSRCQSFAFRSIDLPLVVGHLGRICGSEGIEAEDDALTALALAGDGSIRDSLSALDQAIAAFGKRLEGGPVRDLLGAIPSEVTERVLEAIRTSDPAAMLALVDDLFQQGRHPQHFCGELTRQFRNLLVMKLAGTSTNLVVAGAQERQAAEKWIGVFSNEDLTRYVQLLLALFQDLQHAVQQRYRLEIGLLKLVYAGRLSAIEDLLSGRLPAVPSGPVRDRRVPSPPEPVPAPASPAARPAPKPAAPKSSARGTVPAKPARKAPTTTSRVRGGSEAAQPSKESPPPPTPKAAPAPAAPAPAAEPAGAEDGFKQKLVNTIVESGDSFLADGVRASEVERDGRTVTFRFDGDWSGIMNLQKQVLEAALVALVGGKPDVRYATGKPAAAKQRRPARPAAKDTQARPAVSAAPAAPAKARTARQRALADPAFLEFQKQFEGQITNVIDLRRSSR